jgi:hypothetical protein
MDEVDSTEHPVLPTRAHAGIYRLAAHEFPRFGLSAV